MLQPDYLKWGQTVDDLRRLATESAHLRTRQRFMTLFEIATGCNATAVAAAIGRHRHTVQRWVHTYNSDGPAALFYKRTGGRPPLSIASSSP